MAVKDFAASNRDQSHLENSKSLISNKSQPDRSRSQTPASIEVSKAGDDFESGSDDNKFDQYKEHQAVPALPQSLIYDKIIDTVYPQRK